MPRRPVLVLVGVDGSALSDAALRWAAHEASLKGVGLRVIHVFAGPLLVVVVRRSLDWEQAHRMVEHATAWPRRSRPNCTSAARSSPRARPWHSSNSRPTQASSLGKRGRGGFRDLLAGSVARQVADHASCPVVLLHTVGRPPSDDREIVVGAAGDAALQVAFAEADLRDVRLRAIRTWRPIMPAGSTAAVPMGTITDGIKRNEENILSRALDPCRERHPGVRVA